MSITAIESGAVLRRHHQAMSIVDALPDEDTRLALLDYVVSGTLAVEEAFRAAAHPRESDGRRDLRHDRPNAALRHARVLALRDHGYTLRQIADELGYADQSGPSRVLSKAV